MITSEFLTVLKIVFSLLVGASIVSRFLCKWKSENQTFQKVWTIIKGWWVIVTFLMICFVWTPGSLLIGFLILSLLAVREYYKHSRLVEFRQTMLFILTFFIILEYVLLASHRWHLFQISPLIFSLFALPLFIIINANYQRLAEIVGSFLGTVLAFHFLAFAPALYLLSDLGWQTPHDSLYLIFSIILLTELNDIFQFIAGKSFGRRKIVPLISPNKTEAGFIGGIIGTSLLAGYIMPKFISLEMSRAVGLGLLISISGIFGDLIFSTVKRYFNTKDFSDKIAGHGGYLDRLDSLIFTLPVSYYYLWYVRGGFW